MLKTFAVVAGLLLAAGAAFADEREGEIAEISLQTRTIIVVAAGECACAGTQYVLAPDVNINTLSIGTVVKMTYTSDGKTNLVTKLTK